MTYHAIGLMSGSSLDGLDIAFVQLAETSGSWSYSWIATECIPYSAEWAERLKGAQSLPVPEFLRLHTEYGHLTGVLVNDFLGKQTGDKKVDFVASHGHTVFHEPHNATSFQIGDGAALAAETGLAVISDLRNMDVALGGQGAPIVPIGDKLLFSDYEYLLNLGGIANISVQSKALAFDVCACNQLLNYYAQAEGQEYDNEGQIARTGTANAAKLAELSSQTFYRQAPPKSLSNDFSTQEILPIVDAAGLGSKDALATCTNHIVSCIASSLAQYADGAKPSKLLATGGGAFNNFLVELLAHALQPYGIEVVVPDRTLIQYKEALIMAFIGALRWRNEANVLASVTGARYNSIGGAIWAARP